LPTALQDGAESVRALTGWGDGGIFLKTSAPLSLIYKRLSKEPNFGRMHLAGQSFNWFSSFCYWGEGKGGGSTFLSGKDPVKKISNRLGLPRVEDCLFRPQGRLVIYYIDTLLLLSLATVANSFQSFPACPAENSAHWYCHSDSHEDCIYSS
jgi:hypothetical protein